jgi:tripartite-type tricarboxylate transporter receptor subunit TctC
MSAVHYATGALAGVLAGTLALSMTCASAQPYPAKPVRLLLPSSPGSGSDTIGRIVAGGLSQAMGQQVIVENRPGGSSNIGAALAAKAPPDGYTLFQANMTHAANVTLFRSLQYDFLRDFAPVTLLATSPSVLVVHPSVPARSVADLIKLARAKPGALSYSSTGSGSPTHFAGELFKNQGKVDMLHVPYRGGGEALTAVIAGEVPVYFAPLAPALPMIRQGRLRAVAVTSAQRLAQAPEYPTVAESGLRGYEAGNWYGIVVPVKTPREMIPAIHGYFATALKRPEVTKRMDGLGYVVIGGQPEELWTHVKLEIERLGRIVKDLGLKPE